MRIISAAEAAQLVQDDWTLVPGGFGSCGHPDALTRALRQRFDKEGKPQNLSLLFASASGDKQGRGVDRLAQPKLIKRAIGGFWGLVPALGAMAMNDLIEAHNWPQGVVSQLYRAIAAGKSGVYSRIGLDTFVDPDLDGALLNKKTTTTLLKKITLNGESSLFYPALNIDCVLLRGTASDPEGNISMQNEVSYNDALSQAMAAKNSGGLVIVQVEALVGNHEIPPYDVRIPGILVDYVVLANQEDHPQTYGNTNNPHFTAAGKAIPDTKAISFAQRIIVRRAFEEIKALQARVVNLGIGIPALMGQLDDFHQHQHPLVLTVESGQIGGSPANGLSFGASEYPHAVIEQSSLFDFYEGGGLDVSCLGFAEIDTFGNVNISRFNNRLYGAGGFINISQSTKNILFCGTFTAVGLEIEANKDGIKISREGQICKFVKQVSHLTFSGETSVRLKQNIKFITERAVFSLRNGILFLDEIAPGISVEENITPYMEGSFVISPECKRMNANLFI